MDLEVTRPTNFHAKWLRRRIHVLFAVKITTSQLFQSPNLQARKNVKIWNFSKTKTKEFYEDDAFQYSTCC